MKQLEILYQDEQFIAVYKPAGMFVHRSKLGNDRHTVMSRLRNQLNQWVYPIHRLDRATAGVLLFGLSSEAAGEASKLFRERTVQKTYLAVVRGFPPETMTADRPMRENPEEERRAAVTHYQTLQTLQLPEPVGKWPTARIALVQVTPETGRRHQIRKHCNHLAHPIIGDAVYGDRFYNRLFQEKLGIRRLMLFATGLEFVHPNSGAPLYIRTKPDDEIMALFDRFQWTWNPQTPFL